MHDDHAAAELLTTGTGVTHAPPGTNLAWAHLAHAAAESSTATLIVTATGERARKIRQRIVRGGGTCTTTGGADGRTLTAEAGKVVASSVSRLRNVRADGWQRIIADLGSSTDTARDLHRIEQELGRTPDLTLMPREESGSGGEDRAAGTARTSRPAAGDLRGDGRPTLRRRVRIDNLP